MLLLFFFFISLTFTITFIWLGFDDDWYEDFYIIGTIVSLLITIVLGIGLIIGPENIFIVENITETNISQSQNITQHNKSYVQNITKIQDNNESQGDEDTGPGASTADGQAINPYAQQESEVLPGLRSA